MNELQGARTKFSKIFKIIKIKSIVKGTSSYLVSKLNKNNFRTRKIKI